MKKTIIIFLFIIFAFVLNNTNHFCYAAIGDANKPVQLTNPLGNTDDDKDINILIGQIINAVLGIVGSLALVMFIYGGFVWMLAAGNNEKVQKGKDILVWATIGLVIIFSAYAIVKFVFQGLGVPGA